MTALRHWSFKRVLMASVAWFVLTLALIIALQVRVFFDVSDGSGGIGAVSVGINPLVLAIPVVPPAIVIVAWWLSRDRP